MGKFSFRDILAKMEDRKECELSIFKLIINNFPKIKIVLANWRMITELYLPDTFHPCIIERVRANVIVP